MERPGCLFGNPGRFARAGQARARTEASLADQSDFALKTLALFFFAVPYVASQHPSPSLRPLAAGDCTFTRKGDTLSWAQ